MTTSAAAEDHASRFGSRTRNAVLTEHIIGEFPGTIGTEDAMTLTAEDRTGITDLINRHGHLTDSGEFDRMHELFTADAVYDVTDLGGGLLTGLAMLRDAALALGDANPVAHHVTNIVLTETADDLVHALSKGIGINADGTIGSVTYEDTIARGENGWRISRRTVRTRRVPLTR